MLHALNRALGRTPVWVTIGAMTSLFALAVALPWLSHYRLAMDERVEPGSLLAYLDETFRLDTAGLRAAVESTTGAAGAVVALMAMLLGAFTAGGWLQIFLERTEGHSVLRFFYGGARYFFRFARLIVLTLLTLHALGWVVYGWPWQRLVGDLVLGLARGDLQELESEWTARVVVFAQDGLFLLASALVLVWGDYTRTRLAMHDTSSALWAGLCSWVTLFAHPLRTLRPALGLWTAEAAGLAAAVVLSRWLEARVAAGGGWPFLTLLAAVGIAALMWRTVVRGARYAIAIDVSQQIVRPLARPDPWKETIGGPGGPRYPIGGDEYGV